MADVRKSGAKRVELRFVVGRVRRLVQHAKRCAEHLPMRPGDRDPGPGIVLVAESSVYLASNGKDDTPLEEGERLTWADGMDPAKWDDDFELVQRKTELVGAKDDAVFLDAEDVELVIGHAEDWHVFRLAVIHNGEQMSKILMMPTCSRKESQQWSTELA